jgi:6-phosphogluconate dehydrogenase
VQQAIELAVSAPVISASVFQRFRSRKTDTFADKILAALRNEFGGHAIVKAGGKGKK